MDGTETRPPIITNVDLYPESERPTWFSDPPRKCRVCGAIHMVDADCDQCGKG